MKRLPPRPPLFPYTTLFRSHAGESGSRFGCRARGALAAAAAEAPGRGGRAPRAAAAPERRGAVGAGASRSEEHTSELQSQSNLVCRLLLEKKKHRIQSHDRL